MPRQIKGVPGAQSPVKGKTKACSGALVLQGEAILLRSRRRFHLRQGYGGQVGGQWDEG